MNQDKIAKKLNSMFLPLMILLPQLYMAATASSTITKKPIPFYKYKCMLTNADKFGTLEDSVPITGVRLIDYKEPGICLF